MKNLDEVKDRDKPIKTFLPDALHFQRGIQNLRVRDIEVELPVCCLSCTNRESEESN